MELEADRQQPIEKTVGPAEPSHPWAPGLARDHAGLLVGPDSRPYSYWAECGCPDDCPRDHENE